MVGFSRPTPSESLPFHYIPLGGEGKSGANLSMACALILEIYKVVSADHPWRRKQFLGTTDSAYVDKNLSALRSELQKLQKDGIRNDRVSWLQATINAHVSRQRRLKK